ncbi:hypothetical protein VMCG_07188 [Cytospora schulzeri]|uniref:Fungal N-terminal domain-containing protein n=1 Tax=Cytospora schulzeri TaxID=448051 RepID=A0A423W4P1_9PEZI|nr:hypothetical protein VMCG_07188 [Valsa malicola]
MDPISAVGFVSSVVSIVELVRNGIATLSELRDRYKIVDFKVNILITQLSTLTTALDQVTNVLSDNPGLPQDAQLIRDLTTSLACVEAVIMLINERISPLQQQLANGLSAMGKVNFLWDESTLKDYLSLLDNQVNALNLLLTALQCRTTLEQKNMLEMSESRQVFSRVRDETSSLLFLRDAESTGTRRSIGSQNWATVNTTFSFDHEIFTSKVYRMATRSSMMQALILEEHRHTSTENVTTESLGSTTRPTSVCDSVIDGALRAPPRLREQGFLPSYSDITVTQEVHRFSSAIGTQTAQGPGHGVIETEVTSASYAQRNETSTQDQLVPAGPAPAIIMGSEPENSAPHLQSLLEPSRKSIDSDVWSLNTTGSQTYAERPRPVPTRTQSHIGPALPTIPQGRQADSIVSKHKVLVLGSEESGKSTLIKSLNILHSEYDENWLNENVQIRGPEADRDWALARKTRALQAQLDLLRRELCNDFTISVVLVFWDDINLQHKLNQLRLNPCKRGERRHDYTCLNHSRHFMDSTRRIMQPDYVPSVQDILWSYNPSLGIHKSHYIIDGIPYQFVDVGGARTEQGKWIKAFYDVQTVVFTFDVSCYDWPSLDDGVKNRMVDSFDLWDRLVNANSFTKTNFVVMLTKEDRLTRAKLTRSPFTTIFPDMLGDSQDPDNVLRHIVRHLQSIIQKKPDFDRSVLFCSARSIAQSTTDLAEITLDAIKHAANQQQAFVKATHEPVLPGRFPRLKWRLY